MGHVYREVLGTEKRIDYFIEALKKEELKEVECGKEIDRCASTFSLPCVNRSRAEARAYCSLIAQGEHLVELHLQDATLDLAEREQSFIAALDLDFDTIAAAAGFTKQALATVAKDIGASFRFRSQRERALTETGTELAIDVDETDLDASLFQPLQNFVNQARNSKVTTKKLLRRLEDLVGASSALSMEHVQGFETLAFNSSAIATATAKVRHSPYSYYGRADDGSLSTASGQYFDLPLRHSHEQDHLLPLGHPLYWVRHLCRRTRESKLARIGSVRRAPGAACEGCGDYACGCW